MRRKSGAAGRAREPSQRQLRAGELVRHALVEVLTREEIHDADLANRPITVSEVRMSPDLRKANCFILPLGGVGTADAITALNRVAPWLGGQVARRVRLKYAPKLQFHVDESFDQASRIDTLLRREDVARDLDHQGGPDDRDDHGA
jgi:ribosome-binding factor A